MFILKLKRKGTSMTPEKQTEHKIFIRYLRNKHNDPVACLAAAKSKDLRDNTCYSFLEQGVFVGWSLCSKHDVFCKKTAKKIAIGRLHKMLEAEVAGPAALERCTFYSDNCSSIKFEDQLERFSEKCAKYFKTKPNFVYI
jgi:hypothetical protein